MKTYTTTERVEFGLGAVLGLSDQQAAARAACLVANQKKKGVYEVTGPVQFKAGEAIKLDLDETGGPRYLLQRLAAKGASVSLADAARAAAEAASGDAVASEDDADTAADADEAPGDDDQGDLIGADA